MYACKSISGHEYSKVKGYKETIPLEILSKFLNVNHSESLSQTRWFKFVKNSYIKVDDNSNFKLRITDLKRNLIYDGNQLVGTESIKINTIQKP